MKFFLPQRYLIGLLCSGIFQCSQAKGNSFPMFVGADGINNLSGAVLICDQTLDDCSFLDHSYLNLQDADVFGVSAAHSGDHLLIGAYYRDTYGKDAGSVFQCEPSGQKCREIRFDYLQPKAGDRIGSSIHFQGDALYIGAIGRNSHGAILKCDSRALFCEELAFSGLVLGPQEKFGSSISGHARIIYIGATGAVRGGMTTGTVYKCDLDTLSCSDINLAGSAENDRIGAEVFVTDAGNKLIIGAVGRRNFAGGIFLCSTQNTSCSEIWSPPGYNTYGDDAFGGRILFANERAYISAYKRNNIQGSVFTCNEDLTVCTEKNIANKPSPLYFGSALASRK